MKNKKLFAILTLVCFMFTLMPVAAFAATAANYEVKVLDNGNYVEDVYVAPQQTVYAAAIDASGADTNAAFYAVNAAGEAVQIKYTTAGTAASFAFKLPGAYTIYGVVDNTVDTAATTGSNTELQDLVAKTALLIDGVSVSDAVSTIERNLSADKIKVAAYVTVEAPESNYTVTATAPAGSIVADGGFTGAGVKVVTVTLQNNGQPVVGKVPTISAPAYLTVTPADAKKDVTNAAGVITYNITANKAGNFEVVFGYEDATEATVAVPVLEGAIANVEVVKESTSLINKAYKAAGIKTGATVKFADANGSVVDVTPTTSSAVTFNATTGLGYSNAIKVSVVSQPAGSRLTAANFDLVDSRTAGASDLIVNTAAGVDLKVGAYEVQFALANGKAVTVAFEAAKMGDVVGIRFVQPPTTVAAGDEVAKAAFTVQAYDAKGVTDAAAVVLSAQGKAFLAPTNATTHVFKANGTDEKFIGTTITVLAKTTDNKFVATTTLEVVDNGNEIVYANKTAEVGVTTILKANIVDVKGNKVSVPAGATIDFVVLEKPANAYVYTNDAVVNNDINVTFLGSVAGEYKIQTIVFDGNKYITGTETIVVGGNDAVFNDVVVVSIGADKMIVNDEVVALDVAPFITAGRTMLQFNVLGAFGIDVQWDEATRSVVAEGNGVKVVLTIDSKVAVVNGQEVALDVAPTIANGRTVVPVGFITGVLDIVPTFTYNADGTIADILFTK